MQKELKLTVQNLRPDDKIKLLQTSRKFQANIEQIQVYQKRIQLLTK